MTSMQEKKKKKVNYRLVHKKPQKYTRKINIVKVTQGSLQIQNNPYQKKKKNGILHKTRTKKSKSGGRGNIKMLE